MTMKSASFDALDLYRCNHLNFYFISANYIQLPNKLSHSSILFNNGLKKFNPLYEFRSEYGKLFNPGYESVYI